MQDLPGPSDWRAAAQRATDIVLDALAGGARPDGVALTFLLRRYTASGRDDIREMLEPALAAALDAWRDADHRGRAHWLTLFAEAALASTDERLRLAADEVAASLSREWDRGGDVATMAAGIDACLQASGQASSSGLVAFTVDALEHLVGASYRPGEGIASSDASGRRRVTLADQFGAASALLTAYVHTGRLPYSMLAEELIQSARRMWWDVAAGGFDDPANGGKPFAVNCDAARVLCRLGALHRDREYTNTAVVAADADYAHDAEMVLLTLAPSVASEGVGAALYGLAADEWLIYNLQSDEPRSRFPDSSPDQRRDPAPH